MGRVVITNYGEIEYELKKSKSKRITIKVKNDGQVLLSFPVGVSLSEAEDFMKSKAKWVISHSNKRRCEYEKLQSAELEKIYILGKEYSLKYVHSEKSSLQFGSDSITLFGDKAKAKALLKNKIVEFASYYFSKRFEEITSELGASKDYELISRNLKSVWGSCDIGRKIIKLSIRLIVRNEKCIDSVIYHELAHIKVQNHQKEFYKLLLTYCPNYFECQKGLKMDIYAMTDKFILDK